MKVDNGVVIMATNASDKVVCPIRWCGTLGRVRVALGCRNFCR